MTTTHKPAGCLLRNRKAKKLFCKMSLSSKGEDESQQQSRDAATTCPSVTSQRQQSRSGNSVPQNSGKQFMNIKDSLI